MSRSFDYYDKEKAKVKFAHALKARGWEVYGYRADESDSMTDYWSPASCDGIYTKNDFVFCIGLNKWDLKMSGEVHYKYNSNTKLTPVDSNKIEALKNMTVERGCTPSEAENAQTMIKKIYANAEQNRQEKEASKIIDYVYPKFQENPGRCTWHIEKDNGIFDKGTNVYKFCELPYNYDERTGKVDNNYYRSKTELDESEKQIINEFQAFILKLERIANFQNGMHDGTAEGKQKVAEQEREEKMEKVIEKVTKKVVKPVQVNRKMVIVGDILKVRNYVCYWKVISINEERKTFTYEQVGKKYQDLKNGKRYYDYIKNLDKEGQYIINELKEVEKVTEVEKWVRVKTQVAKKENTYKSKKDLNSNTYTVPEGNTNENTNTTKYNFTITKEQDTRNNSDLWVVRLTDKLEREDWKEYDKYMKSNKGYYSRFKGGHIFKYNPSEKLNVTGSHPEQQQENNSEVTVTEQDQQQAENLLDYSIEIMEFLNLGKMEYVNSPEYKKYLIKIITEQEIKLTKGLLKYLHHEGYNELEKVLTDLLKNENSNETSNSTEIISQAC